MLYVGLDVHVRKTTVCVLDSNGKTVREFAVRGPRRCGWSSRTACPIDRPRGTCGEITASYPSSTVGEGQMALAPSRTRF